jgi:hypothetical protein
MSGEIIRKKKKNEFFPNGGRRSSQRFVNDHTLDENRRRHHGTDPLKPGHDTGDDPCDDGDKEKVKSDLPI